MTFTSGDCIAIAIGLLATGRWVVEWAGKFWGKASKADHDNEGALTQLRSDFLVHVAEDRKDINYIKESMQDIKADTAGIWRAITALQSQIRFVASGGDERTITHLGKEKI